MTKLDAQKSYSSKRCLRINSIFSERQLECLEVFTHKKINYKKAKKIKKNLNKQA